MRWKRDRGDDNTARLLRGYFERQIARVDVPEPPRRLHSAAAPRAARARRRGGRAAARRLPDLVCALVLSAGFAVAVLHVGRPVPLAGVIEARAVRYQWATVLSDTLDSAQETISHSFHGG